MVFPSTIGTIANVLSVIDFIVKYSSSVLPQTQDTLENLRNQLSQLDNETQIQVVEETINKSFGKSIQDAQVKNIKADITLALKCLGKISDVHSYYLRKNQLPDYSHMVHTGFNWVADKLDEWN